MEIELWSPLPARAKTEWAALLRRCGLEPDEAVQTTVLIYDDDGNLAASGSRQENLLKCIAVDDRYQGEGLTATVLTQLRQDAFRSGYRHLFLYTKPKNKVMFSSLFFYPVAQTGDVLLMESQPQGISGFLSSMPAAGGSTVGAAVMNCNPFTRGHRYLIETAAKECDHVYVFVLSEDKSHFSFTDRLEMVRLGTADLPNVTVLTTGPYLISSATFPTYFLKDREKAGDIQCRLDIEIFLRHFVPHFGITRRYVGTEPLSPMTRQYNAVLKAELPQRGVELREIPRLETQSEPISASTVRSLAPGDPDALRRLVPDSTWQYLKEHSLC